MPALVQTRSGSEGITLVPGGDGHTQQLVLGGKYPTCIIELGGKQIVEDLSIPPPLPSSLSFVVKTSAEFPHEPLPKNEKSSPVTKGAVGTPLHRSV